MNLRLVFYPKGTKERRVTVMRNVLFVDPGLGGVGWAFFPQVYVSGNPAKPPSDTGVLRVPGGIAARGRKVEGRDWQTRCGVLCTEFLALLSSFAPDYVVIEFPALWSASAKSFASAAPKRSEPGDLFKLAYLVGGFGEMVRRETGLSPTLVEARDWKGQLPKKVVITRFRKQFPDWETVQGKRVGNHEGDAVGMGIAAQGSL